MFVLDLIASLEGITIKELCNILHDGTKGYAYRLYAGISPEHIPCEADFSNFRVRIGEEKYIAIFHILVQIVKKLGMLTGKILSHDGTLVHTFARYRGCNYACKKECQSIQVRDTNFINDIQYRIKKLLENPSSIPLNKEMRAYAKCPRKECLPEDVQPCSIIVIAFTILVFNEEIFTENDRQTSRLLDPEDNLGKHNLMLKVLYSHISKIDATQWPYPVYVQCPKMPADLDAKIGYRRSKHNPDKKERVFGFQVTITTDIEPELGIELPVACITGPGSDKDGDHFIPLKEQIKTIRDLKLSLILEIVVLTTGLIMNTFVTIILFLLLTTTAGEKTCPRRPYLPEAMTRTAIPLLLVSASVSLMATARKKKGFLLSVVSNV